MGIVRRMAKEITKEVGNKSREFYEFVLPPVDMYVEGDMLVVVIDLPGFDKKDVKLSLHKNVLSVRAERHEPQSGSTIYRQRPDSIDKKILLPADIKDEEVGSAKFLQGVLTVRVPIIQKGKQITVE